MSSVITPAITESEVAGLIADLASKVPITLLINTTAPLSGGAALNGNLTLSLLDDGITDAKLRNSTGLSVIGRSANSVGDPGDLVAGTDGDVLRRSGTTLGFGAIPESSVTGLVADLTAIAASLAARPTGSGTANTIAKWTGASALGDSAVTDDGTTFAINVNKFTVTEASGNTSIAGTLGVTGDLAVNMNKFTVAAASGNTLAAGTLDATGNFNVNTNKFSVVAASGNTTVAGTLGVTGDVAVNTNKFQVTASSGNTLVAGTLTISPMTSGSVLFAGTAGVVSQDNTNFNWDNTNKSLTITSPSATAIGAKSNSSSSGTMYITNTNVAGPSDFYVTDNSGTAKMSVGYGNASYTDSARAGRAYLWRNTSVNLVIARSSVVDAMIFSNGHVNIGTSTTDPGVMLQVQGETWVTANATVGSGATATATLDVYRGTAAAGAARFRGASQDSHFNFSTTEDTYIRGGKGTSVVYVGDTGTGGVQVGVSGNPVTIAGALTVNLTAVINGNTTLGNTTSNRHTINGGMDVYETVGTTLASIDSTTASNIAVYDTTTLAAGVGGGILFLGKWTGANYVGAGAIKTMKLNGTDGNYAFDLVMGARANGSGSITENLRLLSTGGITITGPASIGNNSANAHSLTGTLNLNGAAGSNGQVACVQAGVPTWVALSTISGVTGTGSNGVIAKWSGVSTMTTSGMTEAANQLTAAYTSGVIVNGLNTTGNQLYVGASGFSAGTTAVAKAINAEIVGTWNTTAATNSPIAGVFTCTIGRSAGANTLTAIGVSASAQDDGSNPIQEAIAVKAAAVGNNVSSSASVWGVKATAGGVTGAVTYGLWSDATGGTTNYALYADRGDVRLNVTSGALTVERSVTLNATTGTTAINGNTTLGTGSSGSHTINGKITFSNTATAGPVLYGALSARMFLGRQIFTSSGTYTPSSGTKAVLAVGVGGGGGGGGAGGGGNRSAGAGGGSGVYWEKWIDSAANTTGGTVTIGAAGSAGASTGGTGGTGGDTSFVVDGTTYTAKGGTGGVGTASGTGSAALPGAPQTGSTSGADRLAGEHGEMGIVVDSAAVQIGGHGGSNPLGIGGASGGAGNTVAVGADGTGRGAGGGGANAQGTGKAGGAGTAGCVIFYEFA